MEIVIVALVVIGAAGWLFWHLRSTAAGCKGCGCSCSREAECGGKPGDAPSRAASAETTDS